ncbi:MAG: Uma2 family endonuclease [Synechococcaceae cyanobacterium]
MASSAASRAQATPEPGTTSVGARHHARFSVEEFHRLCDLVPERRLELIDGEVLEVIAKGTRHTAMVHRLARVIAPLLEADLEGATGLPRLELRIEAPLTLGEQQEPEPDLAVVTARADAWWTAHPGAADTLLVIEVADASLAYDLDTKMRLYRSSGIANYWVVDVLDPACFFLLQRDAEAPLLTKMRERVEAVVAELRGG